MKISAKRFALKRTRSERNQGSVLVAALLALLIVMSLVGTMLHVAVRAGRQVRVERDARQCDLLLQAGIDRALVRVSQEAQYQGETWTLTPGQLSGDSTGRVTIGLLPSEPNAQQHFQIVAEYPLGDETSVRRTFLAPIPTRTSHPPEN